QTIVLIRLARQALKNFVMRHRYDVQLCLGQRPGPGLDRGRIWRGTVSRVRSVITLEGADVKPLAPARLAYRDGRGGPTRRNASPCLTRVEVHNLDHIFKSKRHIQSSFV